MKPRRVLLRGAAALVVICALLELVAGGVPLPSPYASALADSGNGNRLLRVISGKALAEHTASAALFEGTHLKLSTGP